jgi:hypothetical protein
MTQTLYAQLKTIFTKEGELDSSWSPYLVNRFISFSFKKDIRQIAERMDRYIFWLDKKMLELLYMALIPPQKVPYFHYIRKPTEGKSEYTELFEDIQKYYHWTNNELKQMTPLLNKLLAHKIFLRQVLKFVGADEKYAKKLGIDLIYAPTEGKRFW